MTELTKGAAATKRAVAQQYAKHLTDEDLAAEASRRGLTVATSQVEYEPGTTYATTDEVPR